jgi:hypothetical protein
LAAINSEISPPHCDFQARRATAEHIESLQREYAAVALHDASTRLGPAAIDILRSSDDGGRRNSDRRGGGMLPRGYRGIREIQAGRFVAEAAP